MPKPIEAQRVRELVEQGAQLIEVLPRDEYEESHLPGAVNIPLKELDAESAGRLDRERPLIVYCWDVLCDMSPRAAWRLESLGFEEVHDYVAGKADWLGRGWDYEGELSEVPTAGDLAHDDVATCELTDRAEQISRRIAESPYGFALAVNDEGIVLGRVRGSALRDTAPETSAEEVMNPGPSTVRPHHPAEAIAEKLEKRDLKSAVVTDIEGRLIGILRAGEARRAAAKSPGVEATATSS